MKTFTFFAFLLFFSLTLAGFVSAACVNSADDYAVEVVLNKPGVESNLNLLNSAKNVLIEENKYILQSEYNPNIAVILENQHGVVSGLSFRIQIPVKSEKKTLPLLKFSSSSARGFLNISDKVYNGWKISCVEGSPIPECEFSKENTIVSVNLVSSKKYDVVIETTEDLKVCGGCDGACVGTIEQRCISQALKKDIEDILKHSGVARSLNELLESYRIISLGTAEKTEISPQYQQPIDWKQAVEQELFRFKQDGIILMSDSDVAEISNLAEQGKAGQNSRIVYGQDTSGRERWLYYYETKFPTLVNLISCYDFPISLVPTGAVSFSGEQPIIKTYYLVPLILTASMIFIFLVLLVVARTIDKSQKKKRLKPIVGLRTEG